ncbi:TonB-dependent receptor [Lysobacter sp. CFH 32150]|uniref:TonB-dependent receptor plug domain-containing protein n=1 Tax=Lysobacter sp. CFH 32150 TaxID=2927128 RepID=UPI001FA7AC38|nr:TonB-dependent receptor [Lysobacter sp. CFH 32150]MCI4567888.1 TonB-dependent receptor [Lysobacter sp. CFH 32150]
MSVKSQNRVRLLAAALVQFLAAAMATAHAQDAAAVDDLARCKSDTTIKCLDLIQVTATRRPESTLDVPAATTIVSAEEMRNAAPQTVMDALHGAVGTFVQQTTPGQGVVIVRGLKGSEVLHLVDGFRLNNAIFRNAPNQYIALVDSQAVDRIEVVRGPSSTLYGSDAMGGVVQMLTTEPHFDGNEWQYDGRLRFMFGSADRMLLSRAEFATGHDGLAISGGATYQDVDDLRVGGGPRLGPSAFTAHGGDFKLRAEIAEGHELTASAQYMKQPRTPRYDALVPGFRQTQPDNATFFFEPQERRFAQLRWRITKPNALFDTGELHLGRQDIVDDRRTRAPGSSNEDHEQNRDELTGVTGQFGKAIGESHYLSYGFEMYRDEVASNRTRLNLNSGVVIPRAPRFPDGSAMDTAGLYVGDDWRIGDRLDLNYGIRYSRYDIELASMPEFGLVGVRLKPDDLTGNIGLAVELSDNLRFISNVGRGFRAPNIFDLGLLGERPGGRFNVPNPGLQPESVLSFDAGFKFGSERLVGEVIAFRSQYRDKITSVLTGAGQTADGVPCATPGVPSTCLAVVESRNVTELNLWGIETGARYYMAQPKLELYATATYTRGDEEFEGAEYSADRIPPLFGKVGALWHARENLSLEAYTLYATRQDRLSPRDAIDPRINPDGTAGWATLNARVGWKANEHFDLALRMENLSDKRYREHGTGLDEPGRNFIFSADYHF